jgi:hypothetical protein
MRTRINRIPRNSRRPAHIFFAVALLAGCKDPVDPLEVKVTVEVRNEAGATIKGASVTTPDGVQKTDGKGRVEIKLRTAGSR